MDTSTAAPVRRTLDYLPEAERSVEEERRFRKQSLAVALRLFARFGLIDGSAGHISARDPGEPDCYWTNPRGQHWSQIRTSDLVLVGPDGEAVDGGRLNGAGIAIHGPILAAHPEITSVVHSHSVYGKAWSAHRRLLEPLTQDACAFFEDHALVPFTGVVLDDSEGRHISSVLGSMKAVILENHGLLTVGGSVGEAVWWFVSLERQCQVQLAAETAGRPQPIDDETARATAKVVGNPETGRLNFDLFRQVVVAEQPDVLL